MSFVETGNLYIVLDQPSSRVLGPQIPSRDTVVRQKTILRLLLAIQDLQSLMELTSIAEVKSLIADQRG